MTHTFTFTDDQLQCLRVCLQNAPTPYHISKKKTSTVKNISSEEIEILPVEDLGAVINMQAGVVAGHFRGGRRDEVSYMIDGVPVNDAFGGVC